MANGNIKQSGGVILIGPSGTPTWPVLNCLTVPCTSCVTESPTTGFRIKGYVDGLFGTIEIDPGGGCSNCSANAGAASWNGTFPDWSASDCAYEITTSSIMSIGNGGTVDVGGGSTEIAWVNGSPCYWRVRIAFSLCSTSCFIEYRKYNGASRAGIYTLDSADPASLLGCSAGQPLSIEIEAY